MDSPWKNSDRPALAGWCPGDYISSCSTCKESFGGDKRSYTCADCAYHDADILQAALDIDKPVKVYYPDSHRGLHSKGGPLIDFINRFLEEHPKYVGTYYRHGDEGYWEIMPKDYDKANHVTSVKATGKELAAMSDEDRAKVTHVTDWSI